AARHRGLPDVATPSSFPQGSPGEARRLQEGADVGPIAVEHPRAGADDRLRQVRIVPPRLGVWARASEGASVALATVRPPSASRSRRLTSIGSLLEDLAGAGGH